MRAKDFLRDKTVFLCCFVLQLLLVLLFGLAFQVNLSYLGFVIFLELALVIPFMIHEYRQKQRFYRRMYQELGELDKKYLITEMIEVPNFVEGQIFCDALYEIDKSMNERVVDMENSVKEFKEYVEMWIHEIKLPLSALSLMNYNDKVNDKSFQRQMNKISNYVEQILFYARADTPQKDYLLKELSLEQEINGVLQEQKELLIGGHFTIEKENTHIRVVSDAKWLRFMLGQIIGNSVKYKQGDSGWIKFSVTEDSKSVRLSVEDHGIGIKSEDLENVFDKSFTGKNGRKVMTSTGMGLYICKKMCQKLGHKIQMESEEGKYTRVSIWFGKDTYYMRDV